MRALHHPRLGFHVLRLSVAALMLLHGLSKLANGIGGIEAMLVAQGLPAWMAYGVFIGEIVAPLFVLAGVWVAPAALAMVVNMLFAVGLAHQAQLLALSKNGGWALELQALFAVGALAVALTAPPGKRL